MKKFSSDEYILIREQKRFRSITEMKRKEGIKGIEKEKSKKNKIEEAGKCNSKFRQMGRTLEENRN